MRFVLPLIFLGLSACAAPMERVENRQVMTVVKDDRSYLVRAVFDATRFGWIARVWSPDGALGEDDRDAVLAVIRGDLGPRVCDGSALEPVDGKSWNGLAGANAQLNRSTGEWRFVAKCS